jgi:flagellar biosynthesis protein FliQ
MSKWFYVVSFILLIYYIYWGISIIILGKSVYGVLLPLAITLFISAAFQCGLIIGLLKKITKILTAWLLFAPLEIAVVVSTVIYVAVKTHHFLYLASYLVLKFYSIFVVYSTRSDLELEGTYQPLP